MSATPLWAALLTFLYIGLAVRVIRGRWRTRTGFGDGGDRQLARAIRAHANFAEYVPLALLLLLMVELQGAPLWLPHLLGALLLAGRAIHAVGISREPEVKGARQLAMTLTFTVLAAAALANLVLLAL